jgi:ssDNA-binding Zn-finger/Zn-ribbon topoisomerase 1
MIRGKIMKPLSTCEHCGDVHTIVLQEQRRRNGVVVGYTQCPACQHRAVFSVTTPQIRELQKRIRSVKSQYDKAKRLKKAERLFAEYFNLKERIGLLMQPLIDQANEELDQ